MRSNLLMCAWFIAGIGGLHAQKLDGYFLYGNTVKATYPNVMNCDRNQNLYVAGSTTNPIGFGEIIIPGALNPANNKYFQNLYIVRFNPLGEPVWAYAMVGHSGHFYPAGMATNQEGDCFLFGEYNAGSANKTIALATEREELLQTSVSYSGYCVVKVKSDGTPVWLRTVRHGGSLQSGTGDIATDSEGNIILSGVYSGTANLALENVTYSPLATELTSATAQMFLAKYDDDGNLLWTRTGTGDGTSSGDRIAVDGDNDIYVAGRLDGDVTFDGKTKIKADQDIFVQKYASDGTLLWTQVMRGTGTKDVINDIAVTEKLVAIAGACGSSLTTFSVNSNVTMVADVTTGTNLMTVAFAPSDGHYLWHHVAGAAAKASQANAVGIEKDGSVWTGGKVLGAFTFAEGYDFSSGLKDDSYMAKYSITGKVLAAYTHSSSHLEALQSLVVDTISGDICAGHIVANTSGDTEVLCPIGFIENPVTGVLPIGKNKYSSVVARYRQLVFSPLGELQGKVGELYRRELTVLNSTGACRFGLVEGKLPEGLSLTPEGAIYGIPTVSGAYDFILSCTDEIGNKGFQRCKMNVSIATGREDVYAGAFTVCVKKGRVEISGLISGTTVNIYSVSGGRYHRKSECAGIWVFDLPAGIYLMEIVDDTHRVVRKIVVGN